MEKQNIMNISDEGNVDLSAIIRFAGAFIAWVIGSGFATGQELLQFFTSYGYWSYGIVTINFLGFLFFGQVLLITGYENKSNTAFNHFKYFCGEKLGTIYTWLIPVILLFLMPVLVSGAGATLKEYYGVNHYIGSALMAIMVLCAYLIGFQRLVKVVSKIGPLIIIFSLLVGLITIFLDFNNFASISLYTEKLANLQTAPHWTISAILYLSLNFLSGSAYFTHLGMTANNRKDAKYGALLGATAILLSIFIMNTAILLNADNTMTLAIPVLFLANKISILLGGVFSIVLILGIFSSCSAMMWTVCNRFTYGGKAGNTIFAVVITVIIFVLGLFSFGELIATLYPLIGYIGVIFIVSIVINKMRRISGVFK